MKTTPRQTAANPSLVAAVVATVTIATRDLGADLAGYSPIDLVLDNHDVPPAEAAPLLRAAGIDHLLSPRAVARYRQEGTTR
jgi:hypothetical protein